MVMDQDKVEGSFFSSFNISIFILGREKKKDSHTLKVCSSIHVGPSHFKNTFSLVFYIRQ